MDNKEKTLIGLLVESNAVIDKRLIKTPIEVLKEPKKIKRSGTSITIDAEIKKQLKVYCVMNDITLSELFERIGREFLETNK